MKLVHATTDGISLVFFDGLIQYLSRLGYECHLVAAPTINVHEVLPNTDAIFHPIKMRREISPSRDIVSLFQLWRLFRKLEPDIVHSHTPKAGLLGTMAARLAGVGVVFLSVFGLPQMTRRGLVRRLLDFTTWLSCKIADRVWCDSFSMRDYLAEKGLCNRRKIVVIGSGSVKGVDAEVQFDPEKWKEARQRTREELGIHDESSVIGFIGRIVGDKGIHELIEAWQRLRIRYPRLHLILVGQFEQEDPISREDMKILTRDDRIHLTGPQRNVPPYFSTMDIYVMPSYREGFGITNIEAAAMGLPVVSTSIPGCIDSVMDGITGTLVPPRNGIALAWAIEKYLDNPQLRSEHGRRGRERVLKNFRPETIWKGLAEEYSKAISIAKPSTHVAESGSVNSQVED